MQELHLSNEMIGDVLFTLSRQLKNLNLDNNELSTFRQSALPKRIHLKRLSLIGNPIHCDCRISWLVPVSECNRVSVWGSCGFPTPASELSPITNKHIYDVQNCAVLSSVCRGD